LHPQLGAAQQVGSAAQVASQQLEPQPQLLPQKLPNRPSRMLHPPQLLQLLHELQQPASQLEAAQQLGSTLHDFSQQAQLGSTAQPHPQPSILARAMLSMSAPKKFHFIEHRLLFVGTTEQGCLPTSGNARCRPTPTIASRDGRILGYADQVGEAGVRGT
jgi:hypothetical protein